MNMDYAAGLFDGEGCVSATVASRTRRPTPVFRIQITVTNCDRRPLDLFAETFGGKVYQVIREDQTHRAAFRWHLPNNRSSIEQFVTAMRGRLLIKADQIDAVAEYIASTKRSNRGNRALPDEERALRTEIFNRIRTMNARASTRVRSL